MSETFHRPENYEKIDDLCGKGVTICAGANDWECGFTWAGAYENNEGSEIFERDPDVWIEISHRHCPGCSNGDTLSKNEDRRACENFGRTVVEDWVRAARKLSREDEPMLGFTAVLDRGEGDEVKSWGSKDVKSAAAAPPTTGPEAILHKLRSLNLDEMEKKARATLASGKVSKRKEAIGILNIVEGLRRNDVKPEELMIRNVPVIPPAFRPFGIIGSGFVPGDANELYKDLMDVRESYGEAREMFGDEGAGTERLHLYNAVKALYGYGDPVKPKTLQRGVSGFIKQVSGTSPKFGVVQRRLISKTQDAVGRGVITAGADLGMDEIGIPTGMAWKMYMPYIQRRLVRRGMSMQESTQHIKDQTPYARRALDEEIEERPVIYSRAPAWHKFSVLAGKPKLLDDIDAIRINPFVTGGLNADFDGDQINLHVPSLADSVQEAKDRLMPSKMLFSIRDQEQVMGAPKHEQVLGGFAAITRPVRQTHSFKTKQDAMDAIDRGDVSLQDDLDIEKF